MPKDSALATKTAITPQDLEGLPFIHYESEDATQQELDEAFGRAGVTRNDILEVFFANVATTLVSKGLGAAIVDPFTGLQAQQKEHNIVIIPFVPTISYQFYILYPALRPVSTLTKEFVEFFLDQAAAVGIVLIRD